MRSGWLKRLLSWLAPHKLNVAVAFGAALAGTGAAGLTPVVQKSVVDDVSRATGDAVMPLASEGRVTDGMGVAARGRTTLLIAHRLSSAVAADRIVVLDAGRIVDIGDHQSLLAGEWHYARLWDAFAGTTAARP